MKQVGIIRTLKGLCFSRFFRVALPMLPGLLFVAAATYGCADGNGLDDVIILEGDRDLPAEALQSENPNPVPVEIQTENDYVVLTRNISCGTEAIAVEAHEVAFSTSGVDGPWIDLQKVNPVFEDDQDFQIRGIRGEIPPDNVRSLRENTWYPIRVWFPALGDYLIEPNGICFGACPVIVQPDTESDTDSDTSSGKDTTAQDTEGTAYNPAVDDPIELTNNSGKVYQAECAFGPNMGDCSGESVVPGNAVNDDEPPVCLDPDTCKVVTNIVPGAYIKIDDLTMSNYRSIYIGLASGNPEATLIARLNNPLQGYTLGEYPVYTGDSAQFKVFHFALDFSSIPLSGAQGTNSFLLIGGENADESNNANIDWLVLSDEQVGPYDPDSCEALEDCIPGCWDCALYDYCTPQRQICDANPECGAIRQCVEEDNAGLIGSYTDDMVPCIAAHPDGQSDFEELAFCIMCRVCQSGCQEWGARCNQ
ncbi:MAG: hypothetical protein JXX14_19910 [Deltaproteobacteria bacterium]|nr:hypothetical protein [Deltaproteobacteria bacterium]